MRNGGGTLFKGNVGGERGCVNNALHVGRAPGGDARLFVCNNDSTVKVFGLPAMNALTVIRCGRRGVGGWGEERGGGQGVWAPRHERTHSDTVRRRGVGCLGAPGAGRLMLHPAVCSAGRREGRLFRAPNPRPPPPPRARSTGVPINYAALSPEGTSLVCAGDTPTVLVYT